MSELGLNGLGDGQDVIRQMSLLINFGSASLEFKRLLNSKYKPL